MDKAMMGSTMAGEGVITLNMARPSVMECATVNAVACHRTGFNFGLSKNRLSTKRI